MQPIRLHTLKYTQFVCKLPKLTSSTKIVDLVPDYASGLRDTGFLKARLINKDWCKEGNKYHSLLQVIRHKVPCPIQWGQGEGTPLFPESSQNCRMSPFFLPFTYLARCKSRGALAFLTLLLQDQKTTLCSVWVICPSFHLFSTSCLGSVRSSLLIHTGLLPPELYFLLLRMNLYLGLSCRDKGKLPQKNTSVEVSQLKQIWTLQWILFQNNEEKKKKDPFQSYW